MGSSSSPLKIRPIKQLPPSMRGANHRSLARIDKAERGELTRAEMEELIEVFKAREIVIEVRERVAKHRRGTQEELGQEEAEVKEDSRTNGAPPQEVRELVEQLKAERQAKKVPETK